MALAVLLASGLLALTVLITSAAPAQASFPAPHNGKIAFASGEIFATVPSSTDLEQLTSADDARFAVSPV